MRREVSTLDQHVFSLTGDLRLFTTHDSGEGDCFFSIGDDEHVIREGSLHAVERLELLTTVGATYDDPSTIEFLKVEGVQRLAQLVKHVVGYVGDIVDGTLADGFETFHEPIRRWTNLHTTHEPRRISRTQIRILNLNGSEIGSPSFSFRRLRSRQA